MKALEAQALLREVGLEKTFFKKKNLAGASEMQGECGGRSEEISGGRKQDLSP